MSSLFKTMGFFLVLHSLPSSTMTTSGMPLTKNRSLGDLCILFLSVLLFGLGQNLWNQSLWACDVNVDACNFTTPIGNSFITYYGNQDIAVPNSDITQLIIGIHGDSRNASSLIKNLYDAAAIEKQLDKSLLIAPWFKGNDHGGFTRCSDDSCDPVASNELYWSTDGWKQADLSLSSEKISSFQVIDEIISKILSSQSLPNLNSIVLTGHSAGGQFAQRYAIGSPIEENLPSSISMSYLVANAGSYLYLNPTRPTWAGLFSDGGVYPSFGLNAVSPTVPEFLNPYIRTKIPFLEVPQFNSITNGLNSESGSNCQCSGEPPCSYEKFKYGFDLEPKEPSHYLCTNNAYQDCKPNSSSTDQKIQSFLKKNVTYILGQLDNTTPDGSPTADNDLDTSCAANFQGPDRLSRGTFFYESLSSFGPHNHRLLFAAQVAHSAAEVYESYPARKTLFKGDLPTKEYISPVYTLKQVSTKRYLNALDRDPFTAMTGSLQGGTTKWIFTKVGPNEYRIRQQKTLRSLDSSNTTGHPVSIQNYETNPDQVWVLTRVSKSVYTLQQKSTLWFLDADPKGKHLANTEQNFDSSQLWVIEEIR